MEKEENAVEKEGDVTNNKSEAPVNDDLDFNLPMKKRKKKKINIEDLTSSAVLDDDIDNIQLGS